MRLVAEFNENHQPQKQQTDRNHHDGNSWVLSHVETRMGLGNLKLARSTENA